MKIATWNVNSITARLPIVLRWLESARPDVLCMQETKIPDDRFPREAFAEIGYSSEAFGQPTYNGVALLTNKEMTEVQRGFPDDEPNAHARLLAATIGGIRVVNVYIPNGQSVGADKYFFKLEWIKQLRAFLDSRYQPSEQVLLCGDFNVAPEDRDVHSPEFWRGRILFSEPEKEALERLKAWGFTDAFRMHHEEGKLFSWWDYRAGAFRRNLGLRIDHIWMSTPLAERCREIWIDKEPRTWEKPSDHAPVVTIIEDSER
ncbi:MAG TPA: exodeoxyribonuclease III [Blastocatellia bacterium]|nr:exodeoxyribonuclease III [Blastocatellia bacterium]